MANVLYEKKGKIAHITLNRPERLNALTAEVAKELGRVWTDFNDDDSLLVAILSGAGRSFCAGADVKEGLATGHWSLSKSLTLGDTTVGPQKYQIWKPIIAAVHGHVLGGGLWLMLECDLRIAAEDTKFGLPEPKIGVPTVFASFLPYYMSYGIASELLLIGDTIDAQRAYQLGLVNKVVPLDQLMSTATAVAERLCQNGPLAVRAMKEVLIKSRYMDRASTLTLIENVYAPVMDSEDTKEGRAAFAEKRKPRWRGK